MSSELREGASELQVISAQGKTWIAVDSMVDLVEAIAHPMAAGPGKTSLLKIAESLRPISEYATSDPPAKRQLVPARRCGCGAVVVDLERMSGEKITLDAEHTPDGPWLATDLFDGRTIVASWNNTITVVRLTEHHCPNGGVT